MSIEIAAYSDEHAEGVRDLIVPIQQEEFEIPITYADQPDLHDIEGYYRKGCGEFWVALHDRHVVGTIALIDIGDRQAALRKMFVKKAYRGPGRGAARRLLDSLLDHAKKHHVSRVYLGTTSQFLAAHRLYEKMGFDLVAEADLPRSFPRMAVDSRFYMRRLS